MKRRKRPTTKPNRYWLPEYGPDGALRRRFVTKQVALEALGALNEMLRLRNRIWDVQRNFEQVLDAEYDRMTEALFADFDCMVDITDLKGLRIFMYSITREEDKGRKYAKDQR